MFVNPREQATPKIAMPKIPIDGNLNQAVTLASENKVTSEPKVIAQVISTLFLVPLTKPEIITASTADIKIFAQISIVGFTRKSLNLIAMNSLSMTAIQKIGSENKKKDSRVSELSSLEYWRIALRTPKPIPITTDKIAAVVTSRNVTGIAVAIWSITGSRRITVFPKSPVRAFCSHKK